MVVVILLVVLCSKHGSVLCGSGFRSVDLVFYFLALFLFFLALFPARFFPFLFAPFPARLFCVRFCV
jgi:hypothetical protein